MRTLLLSLAASFVLIACGNTRSQPQVSTAAPPEAHESAPVAQEPPPQTHTGDDCSAMARMPEPSWRPIHLELVPREARDEDATAPMQWEVRIAGGGVDAFPAVSRDGKIMAQLFSDAESFTGGVRGSVGFFSVVTGKALGLHIVSAELLDATAADAAKERAQVERGVRAANRILDGTEWKRISAGRKLRGPCPDTPWTKLDEERSAREGWQWERVTRFDQEGLDFEYQRPEEGATEQITIRALGADGSMRAVTLPHALVPPGKTTWMADRPGRCGWSEGFDGFGSRELGVFFVYGDENFAGDSCAAELAGRRTSMIRLPPELRTSR